MIRKGAGAFKISYGRRVKMYRVWRGALVSLVIGSLVLAGGARVPLVLAQQEAEVEPVKIEIVGVETASGGSSGGGDYIPLETVFKVKNPYASEVILDELVFTVSARDMELFMEHMSEDIHVPPKAEITFTSYHMIDTMYTVIAPFTTMYGYGLIEAFVEGGSLWKELGGSKQGVVTTLNAAIPPLIPAIVGTVFANLGIPEAISKSVIMLVVMPLIAGLLPKIATKVADIAWAMGGEPPPTYKVEGSATMVVEGETMHTRFSQTVEGEFAPAPPSIGDLLKIGGLF